MKNINPRSLTRYTFTLLCVLGCGVASFAQGLTLTGTTQIEAGYYVTLYPSASGGSWSSSTPGVATVDRGLVKGIAAGTATISYTKAGSTVTQNVTVNPTTTFCATWQNQTGFGSESMTLDRTGNPYVVYKSSTGKASVKKYNGTAWAQVGAANFSTGPIGSYSMDIKVANDGTPYVTFIDQLDTNKVTVMKYDGTNWVAVGAYGISSRQATYCQLAIDSAGTVYLAYDDYSIAPGGYGSNYSMNDAIVVKKFNGSTWGDVGAPGAFLEPLFYNADDQMTRFSFKLDNNGFPMLAYPDYSQVQVLRYDGSSWVWIGGSPTSYPMMVDMTISRNNIPYVVYLDNLWHPNVMKCSGTWSTMGDLSSSWADATSNAGNLVAIAVDANEVPYISYKSYIEGAAVINKRFMGGNWELTGWAGGSYGVGLMFDGDGTLWGYSGSDISNLFRTRRTTALSANVGGPTICNNTTISFSNPASSWGTWTSSDAAIIAPNQPWVPNQFATYSTGTATVTYTNGTCRATTEVTVVPTPSVTATVGSICVGSTTSMTGTPAGGTWSSLAPSLATVDPDGTVNAFNAGTAGIRYQQGGCNATNYLTVEIPATAIDGPATVERTHMVYLKDYATGGVWSSSSTNATVGTTFGLPGRGNVTGMNTGTATISYALSNSCGTSVATKVVSVQPFTCTSWNYLGTPGFSTGAVPYISIAIDATGLPYVGYTDGNSGPAKVKTYTGGNWTALGGPISIGKALDTKIAIAPGNIPYIAYLDAGDSNKIKVNKYDGTNWVAVGAAVTSLGKYPSLAIATDGTPYVAFKDLANGNKASVVKFDGSNWLAVGSGGFTAGVAEKPLIQVNNSGTPYVAFIDSAVGGKATVMKFDGTSWTGVGSAGLSAGGTQNMSFVIDGSGTPYISYFDWSNSFLASVMKYSGGSWTNVGVPGFTIDQPTSTFLAIAPGNVPCLSYSNGTNTNVVKFDGTGWPYIGVPSFTAGKSAVMSIDGSGNMYVAFSDGTVSNYISVMKFGSGLPAIQGNAGVCPGSTLALSNSNGGGTWSSSNTAIATVGSTGG